MKVNLHLSILRAAIGFLLVLMALQAANAAVPTHRYPFDVDATDVIGGANGTLQGGAAIANGGVVIGSRGGVSLPANLFANYDSVTFEAWFIDLNYPNLSPASQVQTSWFEEYLYNFSGPGGGMNFAVFNSCYCGGIWSAGSATQSLSMPWPVPGRTNHVVWTQDSSSNVACLYWNGTLVSQKANFPLTPQAIGATTNNELGNIRPGATNNLYGTVLEFRTYQGALSALEVAQSDAAGPDQIVANPGAIQGLRVVNPVSIGPGAKIRAVIYADFLNLTNVNVWSQPDLVLTSDNPNVVTVLPDNEIQTMTVGTANITAVYQGLSASVPMIVSVPQDVGLVHRYRFSEPTNTWVAYDSVGNANGRVFGPVAALGSGPGGSAGPWASFTGDGKLILRNSQLAGFWGGSFVSLPGGVISSLSEVSIEAWLTWTPINLQPVPASIDWEMVFDFGSSTEGAGQSYMFLTPENSYYRSIRTSITTNWNSAETPLLDWTNACPTNSEVLLTVTYSPVRHVAKLYLNGVLCDSGLATLPLAGINDTNNWLGRSQFSADPYLCGIYDEFRIYNGLLSDSDVQADYAAGPDVVGVDSVLHAFPVGKSMTITWGMSVTNAVLQFSPTLEPGAVWHDVTNTPVGLNGRIGVTIPLTEQAGFYRLHSQ